MRYLCSGVRRTSVLEILQGFDIDSWVMMVLRLVMVMRDFFPFFFLFLLLLIAFGMEYEYYAPLVGCVRDGVLDGVEMRDFQIRCLLGEPP